MADYSTAATNAETALNNSLDGGLVEEYEITETSQRIKRGNVLDQVKATALAEGLAARRSTGLFRLGKPTNPKS